MYNITTNSENHTNQILPSKHENAIFLPESALSKHNNNQFRKEEDRKRRSFEQNKDLEGLLEAAALTEDADDALQLGDGGGLATGHPAVELRGEADARVAQRAQLREQAAPRHPAVAPDRSTGDGAGGGAKAGKERRGGGGGHWQGAVIGAGG